MELPHERKPQAGSRENGDLVSGVQVNFDLVDEGWEAGKIKL